MLSLAEKYNHMLRASDEPSQALPLCAFKNVGLNDLFLCLSLAWRTRLVTDCDSSCSCPVQKQEGPGEDESSYALALLLLHDHRGLEWLPGGEFAYVLFSSLPPPLCPSGTLSVCHSLGNCSDKISQTWHPKCWVLVSTIPALAVWPWMSHFNSWSLDDLTAKTGILDQAILEMFSNSAHPLLWPL